MAKKPAAIRDMKDTLRYKHMVARLKGLPSYKKEQALLQEIAAGKQWRMDAALEATEAADWRVFDVTNILKNTAIHARLQTMEKIVDALGLTHGEAPVQVAFDIAARNGNYKTAQALYERGATAAQAGEASVKAVREGDIRKLNFLLKTGGDALLLHKLAKFSGNQKAAAHLEGKLPPAPVQQPVAQPAAQPVAQPATTVEVPQNLKTDLTVDCDIVFLNEWQVPAIAPELKTALQTATKTTQGIDFTLTNGRSFGWSEQGEGREFIGTRDQKQGFDDFDARAIVAAASTRGWTSICVHGTEEQKEALWREAQKRNMEVEGYEPKTRSAAPRQTPPRP